MLFLPLRLFCALSLFWYGRWLMRWTLEACLLCGRRHWFIQKVSATYRQIARELAKNVPCAPRKCDLIYVSARSFFPLYSKNRFAASPNFCNTSAIIANRACALVCVGMTCVWYSVTDGSIWMLASFLIFLAWLEIDNLSAMFDVTHTM